MASNWFLTGLLRGYVDLTHVRISSGASSCLVANDSSPVEPRSATGSSRRWDHHRYRQVTGQAQPSKKPCSITLSRILGTPWAYVLPSVCGPERSVASNPCGVVWLWCENITFPPLFLSESSKHWNQLHLAAPFERLYVEHSIELRQFDVSKWPWQTTGNGERHVSPARWNSRKLEMGWASF